MKYRPEIDGLRALAVIPVILFHAGLETFSGGFVGVDIFFVISGYLITSILIEDINRDRFSIADFYERRARRILPALVVVSLSTTIVSWFVMNPMDLHKLGNSLLGVATFSSNVVFWATQGYFSESSELNPLLHTWSLAVEEQFYVFYPLLLFALWRVGKSGVVWVLAILSLISLGLSEWGWRNYAEANFYLAPTRVWELFAGSLAALIAYQRDPKSNNALSYIGLAAIVFSILYYDQNTPFPSLYSLVPVTGTVVLIMFANSKTMVAKWLSFKPVVGIGLISYSAYLWHQPLFAISRLHEKKIELDGHVAISLIAMTVVLAYLSWRYIEAPFRNRALLGSRGVLAFSGLMLVGLGMAGIASKNAAVDHEYMLAKQLSMSDYVYFANVDERKFMEGRLGNPLRPVDTLVMGSSRLMQVSSLMLDSSALNLSVSGASVEDYVAFVGEAVAKLNPSKVILGADPWLFNKYNGQDRWKSSFALYTYWSGIMSMDPILGKTSLEPFFDKNTGFEISLVEQRIYWFLNSDGSLAADSGEPEAIGKKAYDGRHIYDRKFASLPASEIERGFDDLLDYAMSKYEYGEADSSSYVRLIRWLQSNGIEVSIVLSPYHPKLYRKFLEEKPHFPDIEENVATLGIELGVDVLGSYNPERVGCHEQEFFDGMHPRATCLLRFLGGSSEF